MTGFYFRSAKSISDKEVQVITKISDLLGFLGNPLFQLGGPRFKRRLMLAHHLLNFGHDIGMFVRNIKTLRWIMG